VDEAENRIVRTQTVFRAGNEAIRANVGAADAMVIVCECGDADCFERIGVKSDEYEEIRSSARRFVVAPGHETDSTEEAVVVDATERFVVIEALGESGRVAEKLRPGSNGTTSP
jgi:hypothetical protein